MHPSITFRIELLSEIFLISVEQLGITEKTLQSVCRAWRALLVPYGGDFGWAPGPKNIAGIINQGPRSLDVVVDTAMDAAPTFTLETPYTALEEAWKSASRWRSLTINSLPSRSTILGSNVTFIPSVSFKNLGVTLCRTRVRPV
jgi:hypothetical protein